MDVPTTDPAPGVHPAWRLDEPWPATFVAPLDATDRYGNTALHGAGRCGRAEAFELLLARGADAEQLNERGRPPKLLEAGAESCSVM